MSRAAMGLTAAASKFLIVLAVSGTVHLILHFSVFKTLAVVEEGYTYKI